MGGEGKEVYELQEWAAAGDGVFGGKGKWVKGFGVRNWSENENPQIWRVWKTEGRAQGYGAVGYRERERDRERAKEIWGGEVGWSKKSGIEQKKIKSK